MSEFVDTALFVSSAGGVCRDALAVRAAWGPGTVSWIATRAADTEELLADEIVRWVDDEPGVADPWGIACEARRADRWLAHSRPDWVVSAGTALAVPWFLAARRRGVPSLWIETLNLHGPQGRAARLCSRLAERVLVQRADRLLNHRRAVLVGELY